jgi:hypothetical protein
MKVPESDNFSCNEVNSGSPGQSGGQGQASVFPGSVEDVLTVLHEESGPDRLFKTISCLKETEKSLKREITYLTTIVDRRNKEIESLKTTHASLTDKIAKYNSEISSLTWEREELRKLIWQKKPSSQADPCSQPLSTPADLAGLKEQIRISNETIEEQNTQISILRQRIKELELKNAAPVLDSTNSGIPPSKSLFRRRDKGRKCQEVQSKKPGPKFGHPANFREGFGENGADIQVCHDFGEGETASCPHCNSPLLRSPEKDKIKEHYHLPITPAKKVFERSAAYWCPVCGKYHYKQLPEGGFRGSLLSIETTVDILLNSSRFDMTARKIQDYLAYKGVKISLGCLIQELLKATSLLRPIYLEARDYVKFLKVVAVDETGFILMGKKLFTWCFATNDLSVFKIGDRSMENLIMILGTDFKGTITCDGYGVYRAFMKLNPEGQLQWCLEHLKRDFKQCADFDIGYKEFREFGEIGAELCRSLIRTFNEYKSAPGPDSGEALDLRAKLHCLKSMLIEHAMTAPESCPMARKIKKRFIIASDLFFTFMEIQGVEPTNNLAERTLRPTVVTRKISYFSSSWKGKLSRETNWTIIGTTTKQGRNPKDFLLQALNAANNNEPLPSLIHPGQTVPEEYVIQAREEAAERKKFEKLLKEEEARKRASAVKPFAGEKGDRGAESEGNAFPETHAPEEKKPEPEPKPEPEHESEPEAEHTEEKTETARPVAAGPEEKPETAGTEDKPETAGPEEKPDTSDVQSSSPAGKHNKADRKEKKRRSGKREKPARKAATPSGKSRKPEPVESSPIAVPDGGRTDKAAPKGRRVKPGPATPRLKSNRERTRTRLPSAVSGQAKTGRKAGTPSSKLPAPKPLSGPVAGKHGKPGKPGAVSPERGSFGAKPEKTLAGPTPAKRKRPADGAATSSRAGTGRPSRDVCPAKAVRPSRLKEARAKARASFRPLPKEPLAATLAQAPESLHRVSGARPDGSQSFSRSNAPTPSGSARSRQEKAALKGCPGAKPGQSRRTCKIRPASAPAKRSLSAELSNPLKVKGRPRPLRSRIST